MNMENTEFVHGSTPNHPLQFSPDKSKTENFLTDDIMCNNLAELERLSIGTETMKATPKKTKVCDRLTDGGNGRRCLECGADKTPQWRSGPMGPKTLCNVCGLRYKTSGAAGLTKTMFRVLDRRGPRII